MKIAFTVVEAGTGQSHDIVLTAGGSCTVGEVTDAVRAALRPEPAEALAPVLALRDATVVPAPRREPTDDVDARLYLGNRPIDVTRPLGDSPITDGCVLTLGAAGAGSPGEPGGAVELRVFGGPAAGAVHRLGMGERTVGRSPLDGVTVADRRLGAEHLKLVARHDGVHVTPLPGNTVLMEGTEVGAAGAAWRPGDLLAAGDTLFALGVPAPPDAVLTPTDDGGLAYNRPPRLAPYRPVPSLQIPEPPRPAEGVHFPLAAILLPLVLGAALFAVSFRSGGGANPTFLLFMLLSPMMLIGNLVSDRRAGRKRGRAAGKDYAEAVAAFEADLITATRDDEMFRRHQSPDPAELLLTAVGPRRRLWERRFSDGDALRLRLGVRDLPAAVDLVGETAGLQPPTARWVPVTVPLRDVGVLGVAGPQESRRALARWLVLQAAVLHSPRDLSLVVLGGDAWQWVRWLPHVRPQHGQDAGALVGNDLETAARRTAELAGLVAARREASGDGFGQATPTFPPVLVVLDGARPLRRLPGMPAVLREGPQVGVYAICLDDDGSLLPEECRAVVAIDTDHPGRLHLATTGAMERRDVLADLVSPGYALRIARALAPVRDVSRDEEGGALPVSVRLLEQLGLDPPGAEQIADGWRIAGTSTTALVGISADGPFALDVRLDGPHGLVAGTTGAGKSELLQTLIASLAVANRPDAFTFVLVDYKGGAAFKDCAGLPHTVGMVTDLDGHLTARALESLAAELRRREHLLAAADAKDIEDYLAAIAPGDPPMPRLMIVIDEFASLVLELPDFVAGLVDIARRGRSLGVHLILATQRPAGVVSADIAANTNMRIALRVADESESRDVINSPEAGRIAKGTPGRAYARLGHSNLVAFQSARVGGRPPGAAGTAVLVQPSPWQAAGRPTRAATAAVDDADGRTDLSALVAEIQAATELLGLRAPPSPWLPPLPDAVTLADLPDGAGAPAYPGQVPPVRYALADVPARQQRQNVVWDLQTDGHLMVVGAPRTGRSALLRTIAGSIAETTSPADVHLHAIDCGNNALLPLVALPHCGAVVSREQTDRLERLLGLLGREITRRQELLAEQGYADIAEQRAQAPAAARLPYLVLLLDRWEGFQAAYEERDNGRLIDAVHGLLAEGAGVGLRCVISADRSGLVGRLSTTVEDRILLRLADPADYTLVGVTAKDLPAAMGPGRGFATRDRCEVQVALLAGDPAGTAQVAALQRIGRAAAAAAAVPTSQRPARIDALPTTVTAAQARSLDDSTPVPAAALVGVGGDALGPRHLDVGDHGPGILVAGPAKSGRSTTLVTMLTSLLGQGWQAVILSPRRSPLRGLSGAAGVRAVLDGEASPEDLREAWEAVPSPRVLVVDDIELFAPGSMLDDGLGEILVAARDGGGAILAAGTTEDLTAVYRGFGLDIRRSRSGVLLTPTGYSDGDLFGLRLPRSTGGPAPAGRGLLVRAGAAEAVQVAVSAAPG